MKSGDAKTIILDNIVKHVWWDQLGWRIGENYEIPIEVSGIVPKHSQSLITKGFCRLCLK